jgi:hypothetical protein
MAPQADTDPSPRYTSDEDLLTYGSLSPLAVGSLLLALLSPVALYGPQVWIVPALGILAAFKSLGTIRKSEGILTGAWLARIAMPLCFLFLAAGIARASADRYYLLYGARQVTDAWIRDMRHSDPHRALQWQTAVAQRRPLDDLLWDYYRQDSSKERQLRYFTDQPLIKTLLLLGDKAEYRPYQSLELSSTETQDKMSQIFAVTFPGEDGKKKTMFIQLDLVRETDFGGPKHWRISQVLGPIHPQNLYK